MSSAASSRTSSERGRRKKKKQGSDSSSDKIIEREVIDLLDSPRISPATGSSGSIIVPQRVPKKKRGGGETSKKEKKASSSKKRKRKGPELEPLQDRDCGICFEKIKTQGALDACKHSFCSDCIRKWAKTENTCPQCKRRFKSITRCQVAEDGTRQKVKGRKIKCTRKDQRQPDSYSMGPSFVRALTYRFLIRAGEGGHDSDDDGDEDYVPSWSPHVTLSNSMRPRAIIQRAIARTFGISLRNENHVRRAPGEGSSVDPVRLDVDDVPASTSSRTTSSSTSSSSSGVEVVVIDD